MKDVFYLIKRKIIKKIKKKKENTKNKLRNPKNIVKYIKIKFENVI